MKNNNSRISGSHDIAWARLVRKDSEMEWWSFHCLRGAFLVAHYPSDMADVAPTGQLMMVQMSPSNSEIHVTKTLIIPEVTDEAAVKRHFALVPLGCESIIVDIWGILGLMKDEALRAFYLALLLDHDLMSLFFTAQVTHSRYHNHPSGLLEHSYEVAVTAAMLSWCHNAGLFNVCLAFIAGLLHDIGKAGLADKQHSQAKPSGAHESQCCRVLAEPLEVLRLRSPKTFGALSRCLLLKEEGHSDSNIPVSMVKLCDRLSSEVFHWRTAFVNVPAHLWPAHSTANKAWYKRVG